MRDDLDDSITNLTDFTRQKLNYIENYVQLISNNEINPAKFYFALATYSGVNSYLITHQTLMENEFEEAKEEFDLVWKEWYLEARDSINSNRVPSKLAANPEIEAEVVRHHKEEYKQWKEKLRLLEKKSVYYSRLAKVWESQGKRLDTLGFALGSEMKAIGVESGVKKKKRRLEYEDQ